MEEQDLVHPSQEKLLFSAKQAGVSIQDPRRQAWALSTHWSKGAEPVLHFPVVEFGIKTRKQL